VKPLSQRRLLDVLAWIVIILVAGPIAGAVWLGLFHGDSPCILCWAQRTSMVLIALVGLFVIRYGPRHRYLGMAVLLAAWGLYMALRHSALHLARDIGQGFSAPFLGAHTYVWSWAIHFVVLAVLGILMLLREEGVEVGVRDPGPVGRFAFGLFIVVVAANAFQAFVSTGPPPFIGQGDPVRFSLNPRHWVWSREEAEGAVSLRGSWTVALPRLAALDSEPAHGPLAAAPGLHIVRWMQIDAPLDGAVTGFARDSASGRVLVTTSAYEVYELDSTVSRVIARARLDPGFSIDLSPLTGAAFLTGDTLAAIGTNKSYVLLRPDSAADQSTMWRRFLSSSGNVTELARGRFQTVRAHQMYVMSLAYDSAADQLITVSVPSARHPQLVVSRFARGDLTLSSEFEPRLAVGLTLKPGRSPADYVVTGAAVRGDTLFAVSAAYSSVLTIDLASGTLTGAYAVPGIGTPVGLALDGSEFLLANRAGRIAIVARP